MHTYLHGNMYANTCGYLVTKNIYICMHTHPCVSAYIQTYLHAYNIFVCLHSYIQTYIHIHLWMCVETLIHICVHTFTCTYRHTSMHVSQDEWDLVSLQDISSLIMFSRKTLHCLIPMTSLVIITDDITGTPKSYISRSIEFYDIQHG